MRVQTTTINDVLVLKPNIFRDNRGYFYESWNKKTFEEKLGIEAIFVQDNYSKSSKNVIRGLHYQISKPQGKLLRVIDGEVLDVVVDIRKSSPTFGKYFSIILNNRNNFQVWSPPGMAHGFRVLSSSAHFTYKTTEYYEPELERSIIWNDKLLNIDWKLDNSKPVVSDKDCLALSFKDAEVYD